MRRPSTILAFAVLCALLPASASPAAAAATEPTPAASAMSVTTGWNLAPTVSVISGSNLDQVSGVLVGYKPATITARSATTLTVTVPGRSAGTFRVRLVDTDGATVATTIKFTVKSFNAEVLRLTNVARHTTRKCGTKTYKKTHSLKGSAKLNKAAAGHSSDMAAKDYFSHYGKDGSTPRTRIEKAGVKGRRYTGENIAAGFATPKSVVDAWIASPDHCENLMSSHYRHLGVGYAYDADASYGSYWTQDFTS